MGRDFLQKLRCARHLHCADALPWPVLSTALLMGLALLVCEAAHAAEKKTLQSPAIL
jgi:hypothetical protein